MRTVVTNRNIQVALAIPMIGYILAWAPLVYVNVFNRETIDFHRQRDVGVFAGLTENELELERNNASDVGGKARETVEHTK